MVRRDTFINKIRSLGYVFKKQRKRVTLWRRPGSTHYIPLPRTQLLEDAYVRSALRQAGETEGDVEAFLASSRC